jgi:hypothetical protein
LIEIPAFLSPQNFLKAEQPQQEFSHQTDINSQEALYKWKCHALSKNIILILLLKLFIGLRPCSTNTAWDSER